MPPLSLTTGNVVLIVGTLVLTALLLVTTWQTARILRTRRLDFNPLLQPLDLLLRLVLIGVCYLLAINSSLGGAAFGLVSARPIDDVLIGLGAGVALSAGLFVVGLIATRFWGESIYSSTIVDAILPKSALEWFLVPLAMAPAVLLEEFLFRGLIVGGLGNFAGEWLMVLVFSVVFGLLHATQGRLGVVLAALASVGLGALFIWRGSLLTPVIAHYVVNMTQLLLASFEHDRRLAAAPPAAETGQSPAPDEPSPQPRTEGAAS